MKPNDLDEVFLELVASGPPRSSFSVRELLWEHNSITPGLFRALEKCEGLRLLSLNGLRPSDEDTRILTQFLASNRTLEELRIADTSPELLHAVFECLRTGNRTIKIINASQNAFNGTLTSSLVQLLLQNCVTGQVVLGIRQSEAFYRSLLPRGRPLVIDGDVTDPEIAQLLDRLRNGDPEINIPKEALGLAEDSVAALVEGIDSQAGRGPVVIRPNPEPDPDEWVCAIEPIPLPDNEGLMAEFRAENSIRALLAQIKSDA
jgi:hypothetical protein